MLNETIEQLNRADVRHTLLPTWYDVDDRDSLARIVDNLQEADTLDDALSNLRDLLRQEIDTE